MQVGTGKSILNGIAIGKLKDLQEKRYRDLHRPGRGHGGRGSPL